MNGNYERSYMMVTVQQYLVVHEVKFLDQWLQLFFGGGWGGTREKSKEKNACV